MSKQKIFLLLALFLLGVGGVVLYQSLRAPTTIDPDLGSTSPLAQKGCDQFTTTQDCKPISLATSTWKVFENTKYGYAILYPSEGYITSRDDYGGVEDMYFGIRGRFTLGGVDAALYSNFSSNLKLYAEEVRTLQVNSRDPRYIESQRTDQVKQAIVAFMKAYQFTFPPVYTATYPQFPPFDTAKGLDMGTYSEALRAFNLNESLKYVRDQKIGPLIETVIDGRKAYQFTIDKAFTTGSGGGYVIPDGEVYVYTITENLKGQKIMFYYYLDNPIAEKMFQTFKFI